jgi:cyclic pyranopterin phosphate synthase
MNELTHLDTEGRARMVDVGGKSETEREAVARCRILMRRETAERLVSKDLPKGDALAVARVAGIQAAKRTAELIPLCHPLTLTYVEVVFSTGTPARPGDSGTPARPGDPGEVALAVETRVRLTGRTGAEMEALMACSVAALTIYDMAKAIDRGMVIDSLRLVSKTGGKSGVWTREGEV